MSLHTKLAEVMAEAGRIPKKGKAPPQMGGFDFVQVGDAADAIRKALGERKVSMLPSTVEVVAESEHTTKSGATMTTLTVRTTWTLVDGESGETAVIQSLGTGADTGDKYSPKAQTNAMKYALLMGFLLSTGDDPELSDSSDRGSRRRGSASATTPSRPAEPPPSAPPGDLDGPRHVGPISAEGEVEAGDSPPVDLEMRTTATGSVLGWVFPRTDRHPRYQVIAERDVAEAIAFAYGDPRALLGKNVYIEGDLYEVPWKKDGKPMHPYRRIVVRKFRSSEFTIPADTDEGLLDDAAGVAA